MNSELRGICKYLNDILNFRNYIEIPDNINSYFTISDEELKTGNLVKNDARIRLLKNWCPKGKRQNDELFADVLLIPKVINDMIPKYTSLRTKNNNQVWEWKKASLLYIKARINKETFQIMSKPGETLIWADPLIKRAGNKYLFLFIKFLKRIFMKEDNGYVAKFRLKDASFKCGDDSWNQYIEESDRHFQERTGKSLFNSDTLTDENGKVHELYEKDKLRQTIIMKDETVFATMHIVSLLSKIEKNQDIKLPLFEKMILGSRELKRFNEHKVGEDMENHLGQMKNDFPLADAQRDVVHCFSSMKEGDVLAVSGPPGTGKTTMLQSIVADMVVKRVLLQSKQHESGDCAPLILASSSNNKAITNIIDAFSTGDEDTDIENLKEGDIYHRWICFEGNKKEKFIPMAVYCPSGQVDKSKTSHYFVTDNAGGGNYGILRNKYFRDSSDFYVRANKALMLNDEGWDGIFNELKQKIKCLHDRINDIRDEIKNASLESLINISDVLFKNYKDRVSLKKQYNVFYSRNSTGLTKDGILAFIDRILDMTIRFDLYWLSVHYNECIWIKKIENYREQSGGLKKAYGKFLWDEIKYICPCVVSTFYMAPKLFEYTTKGQKKYNYRLADLLIVDEARQVSPEIGLPSFALAKTALVVGDVKQIPPVYSIPESSEEKYWADNISSSRMQNERSLLSCCCSNIMSIAEQRCFYVRKTRSGGIASGLFLNEHRRCVDDIIAYSNELVYGGDLVPKRGNGCCLSDIPPIGFHTVDGISETMDGSRFNRKEMETISKWLMDNSSRIEMEYNKPIKELVSIITPFKAQSTLLKDDEYLKDFQIGTVHTFQGAESPIVIFSLVYGKDDNPVFIKNNHELMNVAVSRAKDHFLVFGSRKCIENNLSDQACLLLHKKSRNLN